MTLYFATVATAAAALIGLLFVAVSLREEPIFGGKARAGPLVPALRAVLPGRRGVAGRARRPVAHVTIYRWVQRFTPEFIEAARFCRHAPGDRWFVDETYVKVAGRWTYLYRAIDQHGQVIDVLLCAQRDLPAARRFFTRALRVGTVPAEVTTDRAPTYPRVLDRLIPPELHRRALREQPGRNGSRAAESTAATDARTQTSQVRADHLHRARVRAEPPPRPLRTRHRHPRPPPDPRSL
jgi:transposase-like protein